MKDLGASSLRTVRGAYGAKHSDAGKLSQAVFFTEEIHLNCLPANAYVADFQTPSHLSMALH